VSTTLIWGLIALLAALLSRVNHPSDRFTKNLLSTSVYLAVAIGSFVVIDVFVFKLPPYEAGEHVGAMLGLAVPLIFLKDSTLAPVTSLFSARRLAVVVWCVMVVLVGLFAYSVSEQFGDHRADWKPVATSLDPKFAGFNYYFDPSSVEVSDSTRSVRLLLESPFSYSNAGNVAISKNEFQCGKNKVRQIYLTTYRTNFVGDLEIVSRSFQKDEKWKTYPAKSVFWMLEGKVCSLSLAGK
jgi:hypothetical protein